MEGEVQSHGEGKTIVYSQKGALLEFEQLARKVLNR